MPTIHWGKYQSYEGPWTLGEVPFPQHLVTPASPDILKALSLVAACEGGHFSAVNMYDSAIMTLGLQFADGAPNFGATRLLGRVAKHAYTALGPLVSWAKDIGYELRIRSRTDEYTWGVIGGPDVLTPDMQRQMYFGAPGLGRVGSWGTNPLESDISSIARRWVVELSELWKDPAAQKAQLDYASEKLPLFAYGPAAQGLLRQPPGRYLSAAKSVFLSFAFNSPKVASDQLYLAGAPADTMDWFNELCRRLTLGAGYSIYPARFAALRPHVERLYGLDLGGLAASMGASLSPPVNKTSVSVTEVQTLLIHLGYDLGPRGADGVAGQKTTSAVRAFQVAEGLSVDGVVGPRTLEALRKAAQSTE